MLVCILIVLSLSCVGLDFSIVSYLIVKLKVDNKDANPMIIMIYQLGLFVTYLLKTIIVS